MTDEHIDSYLDAVRCLKNEDFFNASTKVRLAEIEEKNKRSQRAFMTIVGIAIIFVVALTIVGAYIGH